MVFKNIENVTCRRQNIEGDIAVYFSVGLPGLLFSIAEEMCRLWSKIRVKIDVVMFVMQNKLWDHRMDRGVLGHKKCSDLRRL
jgi:hypothetical protein